MDLHETQCCAIKEIADLSHHRTSEEAMEAFVYEVERDYAGYNDDDDGIERAGRLKTPGLITFSGVVKWEKGYKGGDVCYGPKFAAFIRKEGLGSVIASPLTTNRLNHPGRQIQAWMWRPNQSALTKWWKARKGG